MPGLPADRAKSVAVFRWPSWLNPSGTTSSRLRYRGGIPHRLQMLLNLMPQSQAFWMGADLGVVF